MNKKNNICLILSHRKSVYRLDSTETRPYRWEDFIIQYATSRNIAITDKKFHLPFSGLTYITIEYGPTLRTLVQNLLGIKYVYIHWGIAKSGNLIAKVLRKIRYYYLFKYALRILVNDDISFNEVKNIYPKAKIDKFKYPIDIEFYSQINSDKQKGEKTIYFYAPGNAHRDEDLILGLSRADLKIVRTLQNDKIYRKQLHYKNTNFNIINNATSDQVIDFYKNASAVVLPLVEGGSASGQHVILEAIALKKFIFVTKNRISVEFSAFPNVVLVESAKLEDWIFLLLNFRSGIGSKLDDKTIEIKNGTLSHTFFDFFEKLDIAFEVNANNAPLTTE